MDPHNKVNVLLVDDQPAKLLSYEVMLEPLGENLIKTSSAKDALEQLLKHDIAVVLIDVCMPELDGFELAAMIREHPRFQKTAIIFISAIHLTEMDYLRGYSAGAVDYVPVPVVPEVLRAKVRVFSELYRKTRELEQLNRDLEQRIRERTAALEGSTERLLQSERGRSLALAAGNMGSWEYDVAEDRWSWDEGHCRIFGLDPKSFGGDGFAPSGDIIRAFFHEED
jgi:PleD family two-component response regulator